MHAISNLLLGRSSADRDKSAGRRATGERRGGILIHNNRARRAPVVYVVQTIVALAHRDRDAARLDDDDGECTGHRTADGGVRVSRAS